MKTPTLVLVASLALLGCGRPADPHAPPAGPRPALDQLEREEFNFRAQERFLPLFWRADDNQDKKLDPAELAVLWGPQQARRADYVDAHGFTEAFYAAYRGLLTGVDDGARDPKERARRELVRKELRGGMPTLVETDLSREPAEDRAVAQHVFAAAVALEQIYARQLGTDRYAALVPTDDAASRAMFHRNQGPWCATPQLEKVPGCSAIPERPAKRSGLYPLEVQDDPKFCDKLAALPNGKLLMDHFSAVEKGATGYTPQPYHKVYPEPMAVIARELDAAASAITSASEAPFKLYLSSAAAAFRSNDWEPANVAWQKMGGSSSRWYLRVAPDEVYYEPCAWKAGFAVSFARINPDSKSWRDKLEPVKAEMEQALAKLAGAPYKARDVQFKLPDFIDVVLNAGDQRMAHGATIGESLPNWGPVAEAGGRTVVMTNLYTDADSRRTLAKQMASLFCPATNARATTDPRPATMSTVLHEATHNFGPAHDYAAFGKKDSEAFGGPLASTLEELKAQTGALWLPDWLVRKGLLGKKEAEDAHVRDVAWAFGHISRGMYEDDGKPKNYSQLASIQLGTLFKAGALRWKNEPAASGEAGCFELDLDRWGPTIDTLAKRVLGIKARGDRKDGEALKAELVDAKDEWARLRGVIAERWLRAPKATFVYSVR
jgi:hypothetical protein